MWTSICMRRSELSSIPYITVTPIPGIVQLAGILNSFSKILLDNRWEYLLGGRYPVKSRSEQHSKTTKNPIQFEGKPFLN